MRIKTTEPIEFEVVNLLELDALHAEWRGAKDELDTLRKMPLHETSGFYSTTVGHLPGTVEDILFLFERVEQEKRQLLDDACSALGLTWKESP